jgi:hypothetical protein
MLNRGAAALIACAIISAANTVLVCELTLCRVVHSQLIETAEAGAQPCHEVPAPVDDVGVGALDRGCTHSTDEGYSLDANVASPSSAPAQAIITRGNFPAPLFSSTPIAPRLSDGRTQSGTPLLSSFRV